jgi:hypothetical protein
MDLAIKISFVIAFLCALLFVFQTMYVLHAYEVNNKKRPPAFQYWPFNAEMKKIYPGQSKVGRVLVVLTFVLAMPWVVTWFAQYWR